MYQSHIIVYILLVLLSLPKLAFANEDIKVSLPDVKGELSSPINDSRAAVNAFSCATISEGWKDRAEVTEFLKIGSKRGSRFMAWMNKANQENKIKVAMDIAGFWTLNSDSKAVSEDFYLGRISGAVSSFVETKFFKTETSNRPPADVQLYLKNQEKDEKSKRQQLYNSYQCEKLK